MNIKCLIAFGRDGKSEQPRRTNQEIPGLIPRFPTRPLGDWISSGACLNRPVKPTLPAILATIIPDFTRAIVSPGPDGSFYQDDGKGAGNSGTRFAKHVSRKEDRMPQGDKSSYTDKQKQQAAHIEESYEDSGVSKDEAERRARATVNKESGGGRKSGSGRKGTSGSTNKC